MWNSSKQKDPGQAPASTPTTTKQRGDAAEDWALGYLRAQGLCLVRRNFKTPGRGGGEVDLIMREPDGTLVFVEVRQRVSNLQGGAIASIGPVKQRRIVWAARHFLLRCQPIPPCRFDAVLVQGQVGQPDCDIQWIRAAFDACGA